ncbi:hypothetical protein AAEH76_21975, partial [Shewanella algae]|uniref:hypothetical protein n=1 Tax=Shewanella algae TaxID=38313 RepID=UPI00313BD611
PDLRSTFKSLLHYDNKKPVNVRPDAALEALTAFLGTHAPEVADAAADYLARQRANGQLIQDGKRSGRVVVVAHWSAKGSGFRWFT